MKLSVPIFFVLLQVIKTVLSINSLPNRSVRDGIKSITSNNIQTFTPIVNSPIKLPVWPVWGGVMAQVADWIKLHSISDAIISTIGGRVVPMTLAEYDVSPFLLLAHHVHSFTPFDPIRSITKFVLPEGKFCL